MLAELIQEVEGYKRGQEYKINYLARMLAAYDDKTWVRLRRDRRRTYLRAATTLYHNWGEFEAWLQANKFPGKSVISDPLVEGTHGQEGRSDRG